MTKAHPDQSQADRPDPVGQVSTRIAAAYASARESGGHAVQAVEASPLAALLGGIAVGALVGSLIPRLDREKELLEPLGARIGDAARSAFDAGRDAGGDALEEAGLSPDQLRAQVSQMIEKALKAASVAGAAALDAARSSTSR